MGKSREQFEQKLKWRKDIMWMTKSQYVDVETGEIIIKERIKNGEYYKFKQQINYENEGNKRIKTITSECRRSSQQRLFGDN
jgi:hypothetical protein